MWMPGSTNLPPFLPPDVVLGEGPGPTWGKGQAKGKQASDGDGDEVGIHTGSFPKDFFKINFPKLWQLQIKFF